MSTTGSPSTIAIGLLFACTGCYRVQDRQVDGVWVFSYMIDPPGGMDALLIGVGAVMDDCLQVGGTVVIWRNEHESAVNDLVPRVLDGETLNLQIGGGFYADDNVPNPVAKHCGVVPVWEAADGDLEVEFE